MYLGVTSLFCRLFVEIVSQNNTTNKKNNHLFTVIGPALVLLFENRYNHLVRLDANSHSRFVKRLVYFIINYLIAVFAVLPLYFHIPNLEEAKHVLLENFPCLPEEVPQKPGFFSVSTNTKPIVMCLFGYTFFVTIQIIYFFIATAYGVSRKKVQSERTSRLQRQFFVALSIQATVPIVAILIPAGYIIATSVIGHLDVALLNLSMIWLDTHGMWSTLSMLIVHKDYRHSTLHLFHIKLSGSAKFSFSDTLNVKTVAQ
uniref:Uncharacterized protein n=1 Tax=Caenorhabditis japonica TaxID=281687 RepID=A0A8R1DNT7_CAEJA